MNTLVNGACSPDKTMNAFSRLFIYFLLRILDVKMSYFTGIAKALIFPLVSFDTNVL